MTSIYGQSVRRLIQTAVTEMPESFTYEDMEGWFADHYSEIKRNTVRGHLRSTCVNGKPDDSPWPSEELTVYRVTPGRFTRYRREVHGEFEHGMQIGVADGAEAGEDDGVGGAAFALEEHLEEFMDANWASIDFGRPLRIWTDSDGEPGRQYATDVGVIDFLCEDNAANELVVVELKRGKSSDRVVGQILRYMGWVREQLAGDRDVSGIIITHEYDHRVRYAVAELPRVEAWTYHVSFMLDTKAFAS